MKNGDVSEAEFYPATEYPVEDILAAWHSAHILSKMLDRRMSTALKGTGLTVRSFKFLHWADRLTDKSLARIKTNSDLSASEATLVVKALSSAGYIKSRTANDDRRAVMIEVTPLGRKTVRRAFRLVMADFGRIAKSKPLADRAGTANWAMIKFLEKL